MMSSIATLPSGCFASVRSNVVLLANTAGVAVCYVRFSSSSALVKVPTLATLYGIRVPFVGDVARW